MKIFARVKERIIPDRCSYQIRSKQIDITLTKENENGPQWNRLEPNEYTKPVVYQPITSSIINNNANMNNFNRGRI